MRKSPGSEQHLAHTKNFLDAVRTRKTPYADLETGRRSGIPCLLANHRLPNGPEAAVGRGQ